MKNKTLKNILLGQSITLVLYILIYLATSFVLWEFKNPFQWIIDIPTYDAADRCGIFTGFVLWYSFLYLTIYQKDLVHGK